MYADVSYWTNTVKHAHAAVCAPLQHGTPTAAVQLLHCRIASTLSLQTPCLDRPSVPEGVVMAQCVAYCLAPPIQLGQHSQWHSKTSTSNTHNLHGHCLMALTTLCARDAH